MTDTTCNIDPQRSALLMMDYQNGIVSSVDDADGLLSRAAAAVVLVRARGARIGYVRVAFTDADYEAIPQTSPMAGMVTPERRQAMHADSPVTAVHERLAPEAGDIAVRKTRVGAFSTTDLDQQLRAAGVTTLVLAGIATSGVVLSTVRDAADRDYRVVVLADACADHDPEVHAVLTEKVFPRQARVLTVAGLAGELGS
ncbi:MAG: cysteine hydrolase family protein [Nocardioidaceae bacterium]